MPSSLTSRDIRDMFVDLSLFSSSGQTRHKKAVLFHNLGEVGHLSFFLLLLISEQIPTC